LKSASQAGKGKPMNILIFDDDISTVQMLKSRIDWERIGIRRIYPAYNINQAKEAFNREPSIDIMLCDIEAPGGTGIDLLRWVREQSLNAENIFLTNHAEFCYAQEAIQLGCVDYIMKLSPMSVIEEAIQRAVSRVKLNRILLQSKFFEEYWSDNHCIVTEQFWKEVLQRNMAFGRNETETMVKKMKADVDLDEEYMLILISYSRFQNLSAKMDDLSLKYVIKNIALQIIMNQEESGNIIYIEKGIKTYFSLVLEKTKAEKIGLSNLKKNCNDFISFCNSNLECNINCYFGGFAHLEEVGVLESKLEEMDINNVCIANKVFELSEYENNMKESKPELPDMAQWADMLKRNEKSSLFISVKNYIEEATRNSQINAAFLDDFQQDFMQMLFSVLEHHHIQAHKMFLDEKSKILYIKAVNSLYDMVKWVDYSINKASDCINEIVKMKSVISQIKEYIELNFDKCISRNDIADKFYLNPDYLSRTFNKETGQSITEYQAKLRIDRAILLIQSGMSISEAAARVGYDNYSYFSTVYKKFEGISPSEFRKKCKQYS
jgi:two-component system response regulator YesN